MMDGTMARPRADIDDAVRFLADAGYSAPQIARTLGVSPPTVRKRAAAVGVTTAGHAQYKGVAGEVARRLRDGEPVAQIAEAVGCGTANVYEKRRRMVRDGEQLQPLTFSGYGMPRRLLFEMRWPGRVLLPRRHQRRRTIASLARGLAERVMGNGGGVEDESIFVGPSEREETEHIQRSVGRVDDSSDDWRAEPTSWDVPADRNGR